MLLVLRDIENLVCNQTEREKLGDYLEPLCTLLLGVTLARCSSKWALKKVQEIQECLGIRVRDLRISLEPYFLPLKRAIICL